MDCRPKKNTKVVATLPSDTLTAELVSDLWKLGMDVVRLNTAHMALEELGKAVAIVRSVSPKLAVLVDTKGPNIRTCGIEQDISLKKGEVIRVSGKPGANRVTVNYDPFAEEVPVGSRLVCDDGAAAFRITGKKAGCLIAEALFDCVLRNKKSINVPDVSLHAPALTDRDREFLAGSVKYGVDFIAHSFVRNASDIKEVRKALGKAGKDIAIIAKIENREGVDNLDEILEVADGIMVARGDLGIEIPLEEVPAIQKMMIDKAMHLAKPVITATQMLQSMENSPAPTRAEVSDVANAVYDGTDAVMLSGETAHGRYPREAVAMMSRIAIEAEKAPMQFFTRTRENVPEPDQSAFVIAAAMRSTEFLPVKAIICSTLSSDSARTCSAFRKRIPIIALTPHETTMRKMALNYGVTPVLTYFSESCFDQFDQALHFLKSAESGLKNSDLVAFIAKNSRTVAKNNLLCLATVKELLDGQSTNQAFRGKKSKVVEK